MLSKKLKRLLQAQAKRGGGVSGLGDWQPNNSTTGSRGAKTFTFIAGRRLTPLGCECLVSLAEVSKGRQASTAAAAGGSSSTGAAAAAPLASSATTTVLLRRRAVLPGMAPGDLLRAGPWCYDAIASGSGSDGYSAAALPRRCHSLRLEAHHRRGHGDGGGISRGHLVAEPRRPLPCPAAADPARCQQCPWMAVGGEASGAAKSEALRAALDSVVTAAGGSASGFGAIAYLEPFTVQPRLNRLQEAELLFVRAAPAGEISGEDSVGAQGTFQFVTQPSLDATTPSTTTTTTTPPLLQCPLATLEQKRLASSLGRWAGQLPATMRDSIERAYVCQPSLFGSSSSTTNTTKGQQQQQPWDASLLVTLAVRRDLEGWGPQSPLCGPSHPGSVLSVEEQTLVDAVMEAAPLVRRIGVHVMFAETTASSDTGTGRGERHRQQPHTPHRHHHRRHHRHDPSAGRLDCLYPLTERGVSVVEALRMVQPPPAESAASRRSSSSSSISPLGPSREVTCVCPGTGEEGREVVVSLPGLHSTALWKGLLLCSSCNGSGPIPPSSAAAASPQPLPTEPFAPFWRHHRSLDAACSVLLSVLAPPPLSKTAVSVRPPTLRSLRAAPSTGPAAVLLAQALARVAAAMAAPPADDDDGDGESDGLAAPPCAIAVLNDTDTDAAAALATGRSLVAAAAASGPAAIGPARLLLVQCSTDITAAAVQAALSALLTGGGERVAAVTAGAVDVDPLSAAFVAYALVELQRR